MGLVSLSVKRAITMSVLVLVVVAFGIYNYSLLKLDLFPDITFPAVVILTDYTGAGPEDVERLVSRPVEQAVASVKGIKELRSFSQTGTSIVLASFNWGYDMKAAEREVQKYLDIFSKALPEDARKPVAFAFDPSLAPIITLAVSGPYSPSELRHVAEETIQPRLERVNGVASVATTGGLVRQINVFVSPERMRALGISASTLVNALRMANIQVPGGQVDDGSRSYNIQTEGQFQSVDEINHVVIGNRQGRMITAADVAQIEDGYAEQLDVSRNLGQGSVSITIRRQSDANTVITARNVHKALADIQKLLPPGVQVSTLSDQSEIVKLAINNLSDTAWQALLITMLVLLVFLGSLRGSLVVGITMPVSLIATFGVMGQLGVSLNMISMAGLSLAIGMLVDNSVVVVENIFRHFKMKNDAIEASIKGTTEVGIAVTAATLCHLAVFGPLLLVPGIAGQMFKDLALTISVSLLASLFVAMTLMPMLTSRFLKRGLSFDTATGKRAGFWKRVAARVDHVVPFYLRWLERAFAHRKAVLLGTALAFVLSLVASALWLDVDFMAHGDQGMIMLATKVLPGTTLAEFDALMKRAEAEAIAEVPEATAVSARFGEAGGMSALGGMGGQSATSGIIQVKLRSIKERVRRQGEIEQALKRRLAKIPGLDVTIQAPQMLGTGQGDVEIKVIEDDLDKMREAATELVRRIEQIPEVQKASFTMELGRPQFGVRLDRERLKALGMMPAEVVGSISTYFQGSLAGVFREKGDEYDILVRTPKSAREDAQLLAELPVVTPTGKVIPLRAVAAISEDVGPVTIQRFNQRRIGVVAVYKKPGAALGPVVSKIKEATAGMTSIDIGGSASDMAESFMYLGLALLIAIFLLYGVMAALFESLLEPFVILFSIPVMWIGCVLVLIPTRTTMQVTAMIGLIILEGIVVNNAIVLIEYLKQLRERGMPLVEAAMEAGRARLRPVLMTACTTIFAMVPLALELGEGAETWAPMARTIIGGLAVSTVLTLFIVPIVYVQLAGWLVRRREAREARALAAGALPVS